MGKLSKKTNRTKCTQDTRSETMLELHHNIDQSVPYDSILVQMTCDICPGHVTSVPGQMSHVLCTLNRAYKGNLSKKTNMMKCTQATRN